MLAHAPLTWETRAIVQYALVFSLVLLQATPLPQWAGVPLYPHVLLLAVYYWCVFTPQRAHPVMLFTLGIVHDVLTGSPLALHALILLLLRPLITSQRRLFLAQQFLFVWIGMAITCVLGFGVLWLVSIVLSDAPVAGLSFVIPAFSTVLCYPLWHLLCDAISKPQEK